MIEMKLTVYNQFQLKGIIEKKIKISTKKLVIKTKSKHEGLK